MNRTPMGERTHIGFFGKRNAGKSSLVNAVTGQELSVVSDVKGTTTDPVYKAMELLPLGPVEIVDTAGFDDTGSLGSERVKKTMGILAKTDIAVLVVDSAEGLTDDDRQLIELFKEREVPYVTVYNKSDISGDIQTESSERGISVSAKTGMNIHELKEMLANISLEKAPEKSLVEGLIDDNELALLVTPIDSSAPKGRMILPQQQVIRDVLDHNAVNIVVKETQLAETLRKLSGNRETVPKIVITDSQAFEIVSRTVPESIPLTSFSILMARHKGFLETAVRGAVMIDKLKDGDKILISEGCTHHRQCEDIGSVKLPKLLKKHTGKELDITLSSGREFPDDLSEYALVIHCGGCMLNAREMKYRSGLAEKQDTPFTNYGIALAHMNGILRRSVAMLPDIVKIIDEGGE